jgi:hypothetical protein
MGGVVGRSESFMEAVPVLRRTIEVSIRGAVFKTRKGY